MGARLPASWATNPAPWSHFHRTIMQQVDPSITEYWSEATAAGTELLAEVAVGCRLQSKDTQV